MDLHTIIMGLWIGSAVFHWLAIIFAIALVVLSIYILVKDWDGAMAMFEQWYGKVKSRWSK